MKNIDISVYAQWHTLRIFFEGYRQWKEYCEDQDTGICQNDFSEDDYEDLLYGTNASVAVSLWASTAIKPGASLLDETTLKVIEAYRSCGYQKKRIDGNPPDYLGEQCRFLEYLSVLSVKGDADAAGEYENFLEQFTLPTVKTMAEDVSHVKWEKPDAVHKVMGLFISAAEGKKFEFDCKDAENFDSWNWIRGQRSGIEKEKNHSQVSFLDCGRKCRMISKVQEGCVLSVFPDSDFQGKRFTGCSRGYQYRETFLSLRRLRYPMERRGRRGEGLFRRISWEEAEKKIAGLIKDTKKKYGPGSRYVINGGGVSALMRGDRFLKDLLAMDGGYLNYYNYYSCSCAQHMLPYVYGTSVCGNSESDMEHTRLLILWGFNPAETLWGENFLPELAKVRKKKIPIIVIDPRESDTAVQYADQWIPIRPSTDGALADAMAYEIWSRNLQDQQFIDRYCIGFDENHMPEGVNPGLCYRSYLFGNYDGVVKDAEWAEKITGIPAQTITDLALQYAQSKSACLIPGLGPQRTMNGERNVRSIAMLATLTGNVGREGGSAGAYQDKHGDPMPSYQIRKDPYTPTIPSFLWTKAVTDWEDFTEKDGLKGGKHLSCGIHLIFSIASGMLVGQHSDVNGTIRILRDSGKIDGLVVSDLFMTPAAKFADILLPGISFFETENIMSSWNASNYLLYNEASIEPLFGGRFEYEWVKDVADRCGYGMSIHEGRTHHEWLKELYLEYRKQCKAGNSKRAEALPDFDTFSQEGGYVFPELPYEIAFYRQIHEGVPFDTPSGKIEIYSKQIADLNCSELPSIPRYLPCEEGYEASRKSEYPLLLIGFHTKRRCHSVFDNNRNLDELEKPQLWINPADARRRGIENGDLVFVYNKRGVVRIAAYVTERIIEGAAAMQEGTWYIPDKNGVDIRGNINTLTQAGKATPLAKANPQHTNLVQVSKQMPQQILEEVLKNSVS